MRSEDHTLIKAGDATLRMPAPGGQATVVTRRRRSEREARVNVELQRLVAGLNPLLAAAGPLLTLVPQLRATAAHADPEALRAQLLERIAEFEAVAGANGVTRPQVTAARYVLCSFLDEVIAQTPWGTQGVWAQRNLLQEFHEERSGGEKAFQLLDRLQQDAQTNHDLLEFFYVCLRLGFEGFYRGALGGREQLDAIAARLLEIARPGHDTATARTLSLNWQGVALQGARSGVWAVPLWVLCAAGAAIVLAVLLMLHAQLREATQPALQQLLQASSALRMERAAAAGKPRLAPLLQTEVAGAALQVRDEAQRSVVTLPADALFVAGSAQIDEKERPLLAHVAQAMAGLPGQIAVIGHTDNAATGSLQFPSNWHLSRERAQAVQAALMQAGAPAQRLRSEGRADVEPVAANDSAEGRARNRRIEIELRLPRPEE